MSACRLTTTKLRYCFGSPAGQYRGRFLRVSTRSFSGRILFFERLVAQNALRFRIEFVGMPIDNLDVAGIALFLRTFAEVVGKDDFDQCRSRLPRTGNAINSSQQLARECDGCLLFHTTIMLLMVLPNWENAFQPVIWARIARASAAGSAASVIGRPTTMW